MPVLRIAALIALLGVTAPPLGHAPPPPTLGSGMASAQAPRVVVEGTTDGRARLVVDGSGPVEAVVGGQPRPVTTTPLISERTAMALVVDASADGGPGLQPGLGGFVDFALRAPPATRTALVADTTPPTVVVPLQAGPAGVLTGLGRITPRDERQTAAALDLAVAQLPQEPDGPRLVVLYTGGANTAPPRSELGTGSPSTSSGSRARGAGTGPDTSDALAERLRGSGVVLAVVTTADVGYWQAVAAGTGGVAVGAPPSGVVDAFDRVADALRTRSLVTLPAPDRSTPAVVRVGGQSADTVLPAEGGRGHPVVVTAGVVLGLVVLVLAVFALALLGTGPPSKPLGSLRLLPGTRLLGRCEDEGGGPDTYLVQSSDGRMIHLTELLYLVCSAIGVDPGADLNDLAREVSQTYRGPLQSDGLTHLVVTKLEPLGLVEWIDGSSHPIGDRQSRVGAAPQQRSSSPEPPP